VILRRALPVVVRQLVVQVEVTGKPLQAESMAAASKANKNKVFLQFIDTPRK
jgi:hypothetical protein